MAVKERCTAIRAITPKELHTFGLYSIAVLVFYLLMASCAYAGPPPPVTPMGDVLCTVIGWMTGNLGRGLATLAVSIIGVGAMLGKASWGLALTVGIGIAVIFNAPTIVFQLGIIGGCP